MNGTRLKANMKKSLIIWKKNHNRNGHAQVTKSNCNNVSLVRWVRKECCYYDIKERKNLPHSIEFICSPLDWQGGNLIFAWVFNLTSALNLIWSKHRVYQNIKLHSFWIKNEIPEFLIVPWHSKKRKLKRHWFLNNDNA